MGQGSCGDDSGAESQPQPHPESDFQRGGYDGDFRYPTKSSARSLRPALRARNEAQSGQIDDSAPHRGYRVGFVEMPGGVRPQARLSRAPERQRRRRQENRKRHAKWVQRSPRHNGSRVSIHLTNGPAAPSAGPIAWLCPLGESNEDVALKALMDGWFLQCERTLDSASRSRQSLIPKQRPRPCALAKRSDDRTGRSMSVASSVRGRCGLDIAFYGRGQSARAGQPAPPTLL